MPYKNPNYIKEYNIKNKERISKIKKIYSIKFNSRDNGLYKTYRAIINRCNYKNNTNYKNYGGRGIKCEWLKYSDFKNDMYKSYMYHLKKYGRKNTTIDRIDNNGNYCKNNCRWATMKEQIKNKREDFDIIYLKYMGKTQSVSKWAEELNINRVTIYNRIKKGYSIDKILLKSRLLKLNK